MHCAKLEGPPSLLKLYGLMELGASREPEALEERDTLLLDFAIVMINEFIIKNAQVILGCVLKKAFTLLNLDFMSMLYHLFCSARLRSSIVVWIFLNERDFVQNEKGEMSRKMSILRLRKKMLQPR